LDTAKVIAEILFDLATTRTQPLPPDPGIEPPPSKIGALTALTKKTVIIKLPKRKRGELCIDYIQSAGKPLAKSKLQTLTQKMDSSDDYKVTVKRGYGFQPDDLSCGDLFFKHQVFAAIDITTINDIMQVNKHSTLFLDHLDLAFFSTSLEDIHQSGRMNKYEKDEYIIALVNLREDYETLTKPYKKFKMRQLDPEYNGHTPICYVESVVVYSFEEKSRSESGSESESDP
jgi:hypothetical protein